MRRAVRHALLRFRSVVAPSYTVQLAAFHASPILQSPDHHQGAGSRMLHEYFFEHHHAHPALAEARGATEPGRQDLASRPPREHNMRASIAQPCEIDAGDADLLRLSPSVVFLRLCLLSSRFFETDYSL